ncbi:MAG: conserved membrane protein of unknown function [Promethearchaeota archaeon]|nr:MAG: conserved membrane protein of unknown function [Candidatus Lokiarchaeota archaeon]
MKTILPFRHENEPTPLEQVHPLVRFILPFIIIIPILVLKDLFLIITIIFFFIFLIPICRLPFKRILSRVKLILPLIIILVIFLPLYIGNTLLYTINIGIQIAIYQEGLELAILLFLRIFASIFGFMAFFSSLSYSEFIEALTKARLPSMFVGSLIILLHYIPILATSNRKILEAQELRGKKVTSYWQKLKAHAFIMGKSIVMNMERSEKLYESLKLRGFSGKITFAPRGVKVFDIIILIGFILMMILLIIFIDLQNIYIGVLKLFTP